MADAIWRWLKYVRASIGQPERERGRNEPDCPPELLAALRVSVEGLRPWEYDGMSAWEYERIAHAQQEWAKAQRLLPPPKADEIKQAPPPIMEGAGPQFVE